jgi:TonB family protein
MSRFAWAIASTCLVLASNAWADPTTKTQPQDDGPIIQTELASRDTVGDELVAVGWNAVLVSGDPSDIAFPRRAYRQSVLGGTVEAEVNITANGNVDNCRVLKEDPPSYGFGERVCAAVTTWRYQPRKVANQAVDSTTFLVFDIRNPHMVAQAPDVVYPRNLGGYDIVESSDTSTDN